MKNEILNITETTPAHDGSARYAVASSSGNTYTVTYCGSGDGDPEYIALWDCSCPAARYQAGTCKHMDAVADWVDANH